MREIRRKLLEDWTTMQLRESIWCSRGMTATLAVWCRHAVGYRILFSGHKRSYLVAVVVCSPSAHCAVSMYIARVCYCLLYAQHSGWCLLDHDTKCPQVICLSQDFWIQHKHKNVTKDSRQYCTSRALCRQILSRCCIPGLNTRAPVARPRKRLICRHIQ